MTAAELPRLGGPPGPPFSYLLDALYSAALQRAVEEHEPDDVDPEGVGRTHRDLPALLPARSHSVRLHGRDGDVDLGLVEVHGGTLHLRDDVRHATRLRLDRARDGGLACTDARRIGQRDVVAEHRPELDDAEEEQEEDRQDQRDLDERLAFFAVPGSHHSVRYRHARGSPGWATR